MLLTTTTTTESNIINNSNSCCLASCSRDQLQLLASIGCKKSEELGESVRAKAGLSAWWKNVSTMFLRFQSLWSMTVFAMPVLHVSSFCGTYMSLPHFSSTQRGVAVKICSKTQVLVPNPTSSLQACSSSHRALSTYFSFSLSNFSSP